METRTVSLNDELCIVHKACVVAEEHKDNCQGVGKY